MLLLPPVLAGHGQKQQGQEQVHKEGFRDLPWEQKGEFYEFIEYIQCYTMNVLGMT